MRVPLLCEQVVDLWSGGTSVFTNLVAVVTVVMGLHSRSFTLVHWIVYVVSLPHLPSSLLYTRSFTCVHCPATHAAHLATMVFLSCSFCLTPVPSAMIFQHCSSC
jgi:hypothetical protein